MSNERQAIVSWSGGADSTLVLAELLRRQYRVFAVSFVFEGDPMETRQTSARASLLAPLRAIGGSVAHITVEANWLHVFSNEAGVMPRRNKHMLDFMILAMADKQGVRELGMGCRVGEDTALCSPSPDADSRVMTAYLYNEYGWEYRLWTQEDFIRSRYKDETASRLQALIGTYIEAVQPCGNPMTVLPCGGCHKCVEWAAALAVADVTDFKTYGKAIPSQHPRFSDYCAQMRGEYRVPVSRREFMA
jgi:7-cyano-7-deazaguanine synthase in queuosine biosynthesis